MTRELFLGLLKSAPGITASKKVYEVQEGFEVSMLIGHQGGSSPLGEIKSFVPETDWLEVRLGDRRNLFVAYENVVLLSSKPPRAENEPRRAGFL